jgi:hydrogenase-4 component B
LNDLAWGTMLLIPAVITMVLGAVLGVFSNDLKRTLACSSVSQIGFILTGIAMLVLLGEYNALAARGTFLHMLNHSLFKLILFVAAGVVYINRHELDLNKIRGFGRGKPLFFFIFTMAALGITGVPLWSGYISKTLLKKSLSEGYYLFQALPLYLPLRISYWALIFTGGLTFAYMTKLFVTLFIDKGEHSGEHAKEEKRYISIPSAIALTGAAMLVPFMGIFTDIKDTLAGFAKNFFHGYSLKYAIPYFEWVNISGALISIGIGVAVYLLVVRGLLMRRSESGAKVHIDVLPAWLDLESLVYRPALGFLTRYTCILARAISSMPDTLVRIAVSRNTSSFTKALAALPDALMRLVLGIFLRLSGKSHVPAELVSLGSMKFYRRMRHMRKRSTIAFHRRVKLLQKKSAMAGNFYMDLLLFGVGICTVLVYLFSQAFSH